MTPSTGADDLPGPAGTTASIERAWGETFGEPDRVDQALKALTEAQRVLRDPELMRAVKTRVDEQRRAVAAGTKGKTDAR